MAVQVGEQGRIGVAQALGRHLRGDTGRKHECGTGVTQSVGGQSWETELLGIDPKAP